MRFAWAKAGVNELERVAEEWNLGDLVDFEVEVARPEVTD